MSVRVPWGLLRRFPSRELTLRVSIKWKQILRGFTIWPSIWFCWTQFWPLVAKDVKCNSSLHAFDPMLTKLFNNHARVQKIPSVRGYWQSFILSSTYFTEGRTELPRVAVGPNESKCFSIGFHTRISKETYSQVNFQGRRVLTALSLLWIRPWTTVWLLMLYCCVSILFGRNKKCINQSFTHKW